MTTRRRRQLLIVGGGLAGIGAAIEAQRAGLETCLVEQQSNLRAPRRLLAEFAASRAEALLDTAAWGLWGRDLALCESGAQSSVVSFEQLIVATGAFDRPMAFPGWTLPGVMTLTGALRLLEQGAALGQRVAVAGYADHAAMAAAALQAHGVTPVKVFDGDRLPRRAEGDRCLERLTTVRVDANGRPRTGTEQTVEADTLVLAFGWLPEDRLARMAGCEFSGCGFSDPWTTRDAWMRTSVTGVLVAGDAGGIVGADAAIDQGRLAGLAAAVDTGSISLDAALRRARPIQRRLSDVPRTMVPPDWVFELVDADTVICRCEDVAAGELTERIFEGTIEPAGVIAETRATMGLCQGRNCASLVAAIIAHRRGVALERIPSITPRPPIVPVPLGLLAERPPVFASL